MSRNVKSSTFVDKNEILPTRESDNAIAIVPATILDLRQVRARDVKGCRCQCERCLANCLHSAGQKKGPNAAGKTKTKSGKPSTVKKRQRSRLPMPTENKNEAATLTFTAEELKRFALEQSVEPLHSNLSLQGRSQMQAPRDSRKKLPAAKETKGQGRPVICRAGDPHPSQSQPKQTEPVECEPVQPCLGPVQTGPSPMVEPSKAQGGEGKVKHAPDVPLGDKSCGCRSCRRALSDKRQRSKHGKNYECPICRRSFGSAHILNLHTESRHR